MQLNHGRELVNLRQTETETDGRAARPNARRLVGLVDGTHVQLKVF